MIVGFASAASFAAQTSLRSDFLRQEPAVALDGTSVEEPFVTLDWTLTLTSHSDR